MNQLERQKKKICSICEERQALAQKDRQLYNGERCLIFSGMPTSDVGMPCVVCGVCGFEHGINVLYVHVAL